MTSRDWNFSLELPTNSDWEAYVGLREKDRRVTLRVPHGYPTAVDESDKPHILGEITSAVARFCMAFPEAERSTHEGLLKGRGGQSSGYRDNGADIGHSNVVRYRQLIRQLRDPRLLALTKAPGLTTQFDHRYIFRNLERATFLPDGTPVFDHLWAPRIQMRYSGNDMVGLACWMALDALQHLFPDAADHQIGAALQTEWKELKHRFADEHELETGASLFSGKRTVTLPLLQSALETCIRRSPSVSFEARELHHLLESLLHHAISADGGDIFGLDGFHHVWEAACLEHAIKIYGEENIFTCDDQYLTGIDPMTRARWKKNLERVFAKNGIARRPDLVVKKDDEIWLIVDFKYYGSESIEMFEKKKRPAFNLKKLVAHEVKACQDIANIEAYRWLLMQHELKSIEESKVKLELWVPGSGKEELYECKWAAKGKTGQSLTNQEDSVFRDLTLVRKSARKIIGDYASKYRLMD